MKFEICNFIHGSENKNISDVTIYQKLAKYLNDKYNKTVRLHKNINDSINCEILLKSMTLGDVLTNKLKFRSSEQEMLDILLMNLNRLIR